MNRQVWTAVGVVAATYVYFLIFAEFAFLAMVEDAFAQEGIVKGIMGGLGLGGVLGSVLAAKVFVRERWRGRLALWFGLCALAAVLAANLSDAKLNWLVWAWTGLVIGLTLGGLTVTLAAGLRSACGNRLGVVCGAGTGLGYALCNVPAVFTAHPVVQCWIAVGVALAGMALCGGLVISDVTSETETGGWKRWVMVLAVLVWMDSAAFAVIQQQADLRLATWNSGPHLWAYAVLHLLAALCAGCALRLRYARWVMLCSWLLLAGACCMLSYSGGALAGRASWPYVVAVSLYSSVLVYVPAKTGNPWVGAAVYGVAGWIGSALGIGLAQDLTGIPVWFAPLSGALILVVLLWRSTGMRGMVSVLIGLISVLAARADNTVGRGREVYVAEGCIHCHSQYVRPGTRDVEWWGPAVSLTESLRAHPPLYGNRRQGPDLTNVGNRRSSEWNKLHLMQPRLISPGSRMPSYEYLFRGDGRSGADLVGYLESLGAESVETRAGEVADWSPSVSEDDVAKVNARELFHRLCSQCHGEDGRGDGVVAGKLVLGPPDFRLGWRRVIEGEVAVARVVKFGLPGTAMAGHETLTDAEVVSLARWVTGLHADPIRP